MRKIYFFALLLFALIGVAIGGVHSRVWAFSTFSIKGGEIHWGILQDGLKPHDVHAASLNALRTGMDSQDNVASKRFTDSPENHCDDNSIVEGRKYIDQRVEVALGYVEDAYTHTTARDSALSTLGESFHTLQDFYSHSNYLELLLAAKAPLVPVDWKHIPAECRSGYFYWNGVSDNEATDFLTRRSVIVERLTRQLVQKRPGLVLRFRSYNEYVARKNAPTFDNAIAYATKSGDLMHFELNKDNPEELQGKVLTPQNVTLHALARKLATLDTTRHWRDFENLIRERHKAKAAFIIPALKGQELAAMKLELRPEPVQPGAALSGSVQIRFDHIREPMKVVVTAEIISGGMVSATAAATVSVNKDGMQSLDFGRDLALTALSNGSMTLRVAAHFEADPKFNSVFESAPLAAPSAPGTIMPGEYRNAAEPNHGIHDLVLKVSPSSGANHPVTGTYKQLDGKGVAQATYSLSGTLYSRTGRVALNASTKPDASYPLIQFDGTYSSEVIHMKLSLPAAGSEKSKPLVSLDCRPYELVWVMEESSPKRSALFKEKAPWKVDVDPKGGMVTIRNYSFRDGRAVDQSFQFWVPKKEYRAGEKVQLWVDGSGTDHDTFQKPQCIVSIDVTGTLISIAAGMDSGRDNGNMAKNWRETSEWNWPSMVYGGTVRVLLTTSVTPCYEWWYKAVKSLRGATSSTTSSVGGPADATTGGSGPGGASTDAGRPSGGSIGDDPISAEKVFDSALALAVKGKPQEAESLYREAVKLQPKNAKFHYALAGALGLQGKWQEAEAAHREAARLEPANGEYHYRVGLDLAYQNKWQEAEPNFREAVRLSPKHGMAHGGLGSVYGSRGQWTEAEASFREAVRLEPLIADLHYRHANTLAFQGKWSLAEASYREAVRLEPANPYRRDALGTAYFNLKRLAEAEVQYREAIKLLATSGLFHADLAGVLLQQRRRPDALQSAREAMRLGLKDHWVYKQLGL